MDHTSSSRKIEDQFETSSTSQRSPPKDSGTAPVRFHSQQSLLSLPQLLLLLSVMLFPLTVGAGSWCRMEMAGDGGDAG